MDSKNYIYKVLGACVVLVAAVFWLLSALVPDTFGGYNFTWFSFTVLLGLGIIFVINGFLNKSSGTIQQFKVWVGAGFIFLALLCLVSALALGASVILPIIAVVFAAGLVGVLLVGGGRKWDKGDNQNPEYKTYAQRKAEAEAKEKAKAEAETKETENKTEEK